MRSHNCNAPRRPRAAPQSLDNGQMLHPPSHTPNNYHCMISPVCACFATNLSLVAEQKVPSLSGRHSSGGHCLGRSATLSELSTHGKSTSTDSSYPHTHYRSTGKYCILNHNEMYRRNNLLPKILMQCNKNNKRCNLRVAVKIM